jgi:FAD-dependent urate hydroxylase
MYDVAVIGAGPYGLSVAAHAAAAGLDVKVFGRPMASWRDHMPEGMFLKSEPWSSHLSDPAAEHTLTAYATEQGLTTGHGSPLPVGDFSGYGLWFARRAVGAVDERTVTRLVPADGGFRLCTADGEEFRARTAVLAVGVMPFTRLPGRLRGLPPALASHSSGHRDLTRFRGRDVVVVGAGQAALETATLLAEDGARPTLVARRDRIDWNTVPEPLYRGPWRTVRVPHSGLGTGWSTWFYSELPWAVRRLPAASRDRIARTALGPAGAWWLRERYEGTVPELLGHRIAAAEARDGRVRLTLGVPGGGTTVTVADHVIAATGFAPDLARLPLLDPLLRTALTGGGARPVPALSPAFESAHPGLFFAGLITAPVFGPAMRFVHGAGFTAARLTAGVERRLRRSTAGRLPSPAPAPTAERVREG